MGAVARPRNALPVLLFALLVVAVYSDPLFFRRNFTGRDLIVYNVPMEKTVHDAYARRQLPIWSPEISGGRPLLPNPNAGALYPVRPLLSLVSFPAAMRIFPVLHWIVAGVGMIFLLRALGVSRAGSWIGAVTYSLSAVAVSEVFYPHIQPGMGLLPWTVWVLARRGGSREGKLVSLSFLFGLLFLAGDVFTSGMAALSCVLWILVEEDRSERVGGFVLLCLAGLLGMLLALPQILGTALWIPETNRAVLGMKLRESLYFSIHPLRLIELVVPYPFGWTWNLEDSDIWGWALFHGKAMGLFNSLYAGAFAVIAVVTGWRSHERGATFARWLLLLALLVSVLPSLIPSGWEGFRSPLPLRNPEKFAVALTFALALFSGLAFDRLRRETVERRWLLVVAVLLCMAAAGAVLFPGPTGRFASLVIPGSPEMTERAGRLIPGVLAEGGLLWVTTWIAIDLLRRRSRSAVASSLALLTLVPIASNRKIARTLTEAEIFAPTPLARLLDREDPNREYRTLGESLYRKDRSQIVFAGRDDEYTDAGRRFWTHHTPALWGRGMVFNLNFDAGDFSRMESLRTFSLIAARFSGSATLFGSLSLKYGIRFRDQKALPGYHSVGGDSLQSWDVQKDALPHIRLAESWTEENSPLAALNTLPRLGAREVVIETGVRRRGRSRPGTVKVLRNVPEKLVVEVDSPDAGWLFVLRSHWMHRTVLVDGQQAADVPAQVAFSAVRVPAGNHRIDWRERVPGLEVSRWGPVAFVFILAVLSVRGRRRRGALGDERRS
jgi:hypothetical protein